MINLIEFLTLYESEKISSSSFSEFSKSIINSSSFVFESNSFAFSEVNERETMRQRQAEGIKMAKQRGVKFGRPAKEIPDNFVEIVNLYKEQKITAMTAIKLSGLTRGTFYRKLKNCVFQ